MKVIIYGGRTYTLTQPHWTWLDSIHDKYEITEVIQGEQDGADVGGKLWALRKGIDVCGFYPNWKKHGPSGGPRRNTRMIRYLCLQDEDVAGIEFPGMVGTKDCHDKLTKAGVHIFKYKGPKSKDLPLP